MTAESPDALGGRLPLADPAELDAAQRALFYRTVANAVPWGADAGFRVTASDGRLIGPFNAALLRPALAQAMADLSVAEKIHTSLSDRVREVIILAVGAVWEAEYELYAHTALARRAGLSEEAITMIVSGAEPADLGERETLALRLTKQLSTDHRVDDDLYAQAEDAFGPAGLFDIACLIGNYHSVCTALTLFSIPAPRESGQP